MLCNSMRTCVLMRQRLAFFDSKVYGEEGKPPSYSPPHHTRRISSERQFVARLGLSEVTIVSWVFNTRGDANKGFRPPKVRVLWAKQRKSRDFAQVSSGIVVGLKGEPNLKPLKALSWSKPQPEGPHRAFPNRARLATPLPGEHPAAEPRFGFPISQMNSATNRLSDSRSWPGRP